MAANHWMQGVAKMEKKGALRATAKRMGLVHGDAPLSETVLGKLAHSKNPTTRKRAALAEVYKHANHRGR